MSDEKYIIEFNREMSHRNKRIAEDIVEKREGKFLLCPKCNGSGFTKDYSRWCRYCATKGFVDWIQAVMLRDFTKIETHRGKYAEY